MTEKKNQSIADEVFERVESDILGGVFPPGEIVSEPRLCELLGVSRTPVREALGRLRQEGLVEESGKGTVVVGIDRSDLDDIYEVRARIEGLAAARCAERADAAALGRLFDILELQEFYVAKQNPEGIRNLDSEFHSAIYELCGSRTLGTLLGELHRKVRLYRRASVENPDRAVEAVAEHRAIYEAIAAHDSSRAMALTADHVRNAHESIRRSLGK